jgi:hypothetical protein
MWNCHFCTQAISDLSVVNRDPPRHTLNTYLIFSVFIAISQILSSYLLVHFLSLCVHILHSNLMRAVSNYFVINTWNGVGAQLSVGLAMKSEQSLCDTGTPHPSTMNENSPIFVWTGQNLELIFTIWIIRIVEWLNSMSLVLAHWKWCS